MLLITVLTIFFIQHAFALGPAQITKRVVSTASNAIFPRAKCNSDNCLRHLINTPTAASQLCSTYAGSTIITTLTINPSATVSSTTTISIPQLAKRVTLTKATSSSSLLIPTECAVSASTPLASRLSSACACLTLLPRTPLVVVTATIYASTITTTQIISTTTTIPRPFSTSSTSSTPSTPIPSSRDSCTPLGEIFDSTWGKSFQLHCNTANHINSSPTPLATQVVASFTACMDWCTTVINCNYVDYSRTSGSCILLNITSDIDAPYTLLGNDGAELIPEASSCSSASSSSQSTAAASTSPNAAATASPSIPSNQAVPLTASCVSYGENWFGAGVKFEIVCDKMLVPDGIIVQTYTAAVGTMTFDDCMNNCEGSYHYGNPKCHAVNFDGSTTDPNGVVTCTLLTTSLSANGAVTAPGIRYAYLLDGDLGR